ncbi:MLO-like protein 1 [Eucalyptus grandis]|uniref:MLO-like protein 1 n=1 Tax=Eucalyptus grandis TaxID=71139 RepID=UPI00192E7B08|nr:MLO-like protein 1 [Eucalyptus grandis]
MIIQWSMLEIYDEWSKKDDIQNVLTKILERYKNPLGSFRYMLVSILQKTFTSLTEHEYIALRQNFIAARNPKEPGKDFQKYIMRTLQKDFEKMMGIRWYLWLCAVIYLLVNVAGWNAHFWVSFIPFTLMVIISIKLERMIMKLAKEVAKKHKHDEDKSSENSAKDLVFKFSEDDFWFAGLKMVGRLLHIVLFVNSLELAFFFFIMFQYGFHSCIVGKVGFVVPRIVMGVIVQIVCSSRILPLHAIIQSQMHLEKKQSDKQKKIRKIRRHLEKYASDEEEEKEIVTWISELIDNRKEPNSPEKSPDIELASTDSREGSVKSKVSDSQKKVSQGRGSSGEGKASLIAGQTGQGRHGRSNRRSGIDEGGRLGVVGVGQTTGSAAATGGDGSPEGTGVVVRRRALRLEWVRQGAVRAAASRLLAKEARRGALALGRLDLE